MRSDADAGTPAMSSASVQSGPRPCGTEDSLGISMVINGPITSSVRPATAANEGWPKFAELLLMISLCPIHWACVGFG
jgi:hypothetical protein